MRKCKMGIEKLAEGGKISDSNLRYLQFLKDIFEVSSAS